MKVGALLFGLALTTTTTLVDEEVKGARYGTGGHYVIMFTCTHCNSKNTKKFSKGSYHTGVVLIRCDGCEKLHLIADNLGWFREQKTNIEDLAKETGRSFLHIKDHPELSAILGQQLKLATGKDANSKKEGEES